MLGSSSAAWSRSAIRSRSFSRRAPCGSTPGPPGRAEPEPPTGPIAMASIAIRTAGPADAATIVRLIRELAAYENLLEQAHITEADVLRDGFGAHPCFECLLAEAGGEAVGFAIHRPNYSTFERPSGAVRRGPVRRRAGAQARGRAHADGAPCRDRAGARLLAHEPRGAALEPRARLLRSPGFRTARGMAALPAVRATPSPASPPRIAARPRAPESKQAVVPA